MLMNPKHWLKGIGITLLSLAGLLWTWYTALTEGWFYIYAGLGLPLFAVYGVASCFLVPPKEERQARGEDTSDLSSWEILTPRWWAVMVVGVAAGLVNLWLLNSGNLLG